MSICPSNFVCFVIWIIEMEVIGFRHGGQKNIIVPFEQYTIPVFCYDKKKILQPF